MVVTGKTAEAEAREQAIGNLESRENGSKPSNVASDIRNFSIDPNASDIQSRSNIKRTRM